jgi:hypothetical protein
MSSTGAQQNGSSTPSCQTLLPSSPVARRHDTPTSDNQQQPSPTEYDTIKAILTPYWHIFTTVVQTVNIQQVTAITHTDTNPPCYTCHTSPVHFASGPAAFPPDTSPEIQVAVQKLDLCDMAVHTLLPYLQTSLQHIGARVDWLTVTPHRNILIRYATDIAPPAGSHSVCVVTSASRETFIVDFTVEQLGFGDEWWFAEEQMYLAACTEDGYLGLEDEAYMESMERVLSGEGNEGSFHIMEKVREVCEEVDEEDLEVLRARAVEVVRREDEDEVD